mmetsp:Transcript_7505/g.21227  ORF Transcript_7505/g.21227 Transcript_7505/m.21227 type:complete len:205 (-) Transcript_7505:74-688(-)
MTEAPLSQRPSDASRPEQAGFMVACRAGDPGRALAMLHALGGRADAVLGEARSEDGDTPAHLAVLAGHLELLLALLKSVPSMARAENLLGQTALDLAAEKGALAMVLQIQQLEAPEVEHMHLARDYYACVSCGLCVVGRQRLGARVCDKNRDHRWAGESASDRPKHLAFVRAVDFAEATRRLRSEQGREPPRQRGWWCKAPPEK